ncbi:uncharacterized protein LOC107174838 [Citrus sinensis]|uniref:uncharacterized protein LOC107174838 n=1 Tax=Citrus sinensis TaxID=2711 RepID=UPI0022774CFD|nr:uncharacterized protein LOC107174838 [Citrus sinensis]
MMKSIIFAIALSSLISLYNVEATSRGLVGQVAPELQNICSKTDYSEECISTLPKFLAGQSIDGNSALIAGLKALEAETTKAITEADKLTKEKPSEKDAEELMVGTAVYNVVSQSTKKANEAISTHQNDLLIKEIKLASEVTGDLLDIFQENVDGKKDVMKDINIYIHKLSQINFDILDNFVKPQESNDEAEKEKEEEEDNADEEELTNEEEKEEEEEAEAPGPASEEEEGEEEAEAPGSAEEAEEEAEAPGPADEEEEETDAPGSAQEEESEAPTPSPQ